MWISPSAAFTFRLGPFVDAADGFTAETALTIVQADVRLSKAGGAFAQKSDATGAVHDTLGWYVVVLDAADTDTPGPLVVAVHVAGARPVHVEFQVAIVPTEVSGAPTTAAERRAMQERLASQGDAITRRGPSSTS